MRDLRLIGVHEDGRHLLLADGEGGRFRLPLDDALRAAARRDRPRLGQIQIELDGGMRPREVQALIRSGLTSEEVAERAGWTVEKVHRYEGPVLAEREYVAELARGVRLRSSGSPGGHTLAGRVGERLAGRGVDAADAAWDAAREPQGQWTVLLRFPAGGRQRTAVWAFDLATRHVSPKDDEARWLTADDAEPAGPLATGVSAAAAPAEVDVYDVESDGGVGGTRSRPEHEPVDLMAAMRESSARGRRSRRRGASHQQPTLTPVDDVVPVEDADAPPRAEDAPVARSVPAPDPEAQSGSGAQSGTEAGSDPEAQSGTEAGSDPEAQSGNEAGTDRGTAPVAESGTVGESEGVVAPGPEGADPTAPSEGTSSPESAVDTQVPAAPSEGGSRTVPAPDA
ncbi:septation protein SepH, partial [Nostocoides japonicum]|uniref:septation protein SepH n=1 Tax=Nostocoides japonicum TaxID=99481 RepID=UPI00069DA23B